MSEPGRMGEEERRRRIAEMTPPLAVTLRRRRAGYQEWQPLDLGSTGDWTCEMIGDLERFTGEVLGDGIYAATVGDSLGQTLRWEFAHRVAHSDVQPVVAANPNPARGSVGVIPGKTTLRLPTGETIIVDEWHCEYLHTRVPWGGHILVLEGGEARVLEAIIYGAGVLVPSRASGQHELGDLLVEIVNADGNRHPILRAPVQALAQRQQHLWNLEEYFAPRALWSVAAELGERLRQTAVDQLVETESAAKANANLESVRKYIALVHQEYVSYASVVGPGTVLPGRVNHGDRLWITHEARVSRGGRVFEDVETPMYWGDGFLVEQTALVKCRRGGGE